MSTSLKVVLLGSIVSVASLAGARAADFPQAEPVENVKVCETYGAGFWYIPGTDTCMRIGGYVRFQTYAHSSNAAGDTWEGDPFLVNDDRNNVQNDTFSFYTRGLVNFDARSETSYGTLRSFVQIRGTARDADNATVELDKAFLQFAGFTAGLAPSFFIIEQAADYFATHNADFTEDTILLGYTAELGNGFSASVALESGERGNDGVAEDAYFGPEKSTFEDTRTELPAGVANLTVKQSWGSASVVGAVGESKSNLALLDDDDETTASASDSTVGWAVAGGLTINLPSLGEGDAVSAKATYSDGLSFYGLGTGEYVPGNFTWTAEDTDDTFLSDSVKIFSAYAGYVHNWTSTIRSNFGASYADIDFGTGEDSTAWGVTGTANVIWSPVKNLDIGLELIYSHVDAEAGAAEIIGIGADGDSLEDDSFGAIFRIQRNFGS